MNGIVAFCKLAKHLFHDSSFDINRFVVFVFLQRALKPDVSCTNSNILRLAFG